VLRQAVVKGSKRAQLRGRGHHDGARARARARPDDGPPADPLQEAASSHDEARAAAAAAAPPPASRCARYLAFRQRKALFCPPAGPGGEAIQSKFKVHRLLPSTRLRSLLLPSGECPRQAMLFRRPSRLAAGRRIGAPARPRWRVRSRLAAGGASANSKEKSQTETTTTETTTETIIIIHRHHCHHDHHMMMTMHDDCDSDCDVQLRSRRDAELSTTA
jgi:hypothetical protein